MAQTVYIAEYSGVEEGYILARGYFFDKEDLISEARDAELFGDFEVNVTGFNIGEGESDIDCFFSDEELEKAYHADQIYDGGNYKGHDVSIFSHLNVSITVGEDEEEEDFY